MRSDPTGRCGLTESESRSTDDRFLELMLGEDWLLQQEFEAIIAANWPPLPVVRRHHGPAPRERARAWSRQVHRRPIATALRRRWWARQRAPPPASGRRSVSGVVS
ncbi:hypothetical protein MWU75_10230 [Ornithinimicrobium sp. F0845]|uniref:hypothetical protein n=1 Tax=Ornithinimicrobium sp. F0845 TaxID=2926412 RepID=UPI001FF2E39E|nr:hypothetical protein [Ornithinimicrobium sp. F0845]MCK0112515.1 hypothetical protein [Ornithinimicrobium sp. F0845]